jgi:hypothetical protein
LTPNKKMYKKLRKIDEDEDSKTKLTVIKDLFSFLLNKNTKMKFPLNGNMKRELSEISINISFSPPRNENLFCVVFLVLVTIMTNTRWWWRRWRCGEEKRRRKILCDCRLIINAVAFSCVWRNNNKNRLKRSLIDVENV